MPDLNPIEQIALVFIALFLFADWLVISGKT
jgi:hypothetical protein